MFIPDPDVYPFNPKYFFQALENMIQNVHPRIRIPDLDFLPILDRGVKKAPDPRSGSATTLLARLEDKTVGSPTALMSPVLPPWIAALGTDSAYAG